MRSSRILRKIRDRQVARICALASYLPYFPAIAARAGFDGVWVDGEHKPFDPREVQALVGFHHLADIDCLWRPPTREKAALYRILEDGATGLIIPHVESVDEARALVVATKFPPLGNRGLDGAALDADFGRSSGAEYPAAANRETILFPQVETPQALEQVEAIAALDGIDGIFVGPGDMALRLACDPLPGDPKMIAVYRRVATATARCGKTWGCPVTTVRDLELILKAGAGFVVYGAEIRLIRAGLKECADAFDRVLSGQAREPQSRSPN
jgi:4-hydroxy-2-oxoheptanedioate aldolase